MEKSQKADAVEQADFVLKHRVVGAGILLLFGALVLPWLLGPPSEASKLVGSSDSSFDVAHQLDSQDRPINPSLASENSLVEDELLAAIEAQDQEAEERIYISKITPLDVRGSSESESTAKPREDSTQDKLEQTLEKIADSSEPKSTKTNSTSVAKNASENKEDAKKDSKAKQEELKVAAVPNKEPESPVAKIELGWAVQVGVFTDKKGADKVVQDLQSKGFSPSTSVVDTNRGKDTGTRVWLGPFAQRVDAAKAKTRLTDKTGEPGFIRAYP